MRGQIHAAAGRLYPPGRHLSSSPDLACVVKGSLPLVNILYIGSIRASAPAHRPVRMHRHHHAEARQQRYRRGAAEAQ